MNFGDDDGVGTTVEVVVDKVPPSLPTLYKTGNIFKVYCYLY